jgi:transposase
MQCIKLGSTFAWSTLAKCETLQKRFYDRLVAAGKFKKVALNAAMRKLLTLLNQMVHHGTRWQAVDVQMM